MQAQDKNTIDFVRDIKPILSDRCFQCHGPDENQRKADLRLDLPQEDVGSVIKVGNADQSDLIARIASDDPDQAMPPPDANKKALTAKEIATFKAWINQEPNLRDTGLTKAQASARCRGPPHYRIGLKHPSTFLSPNILKKQEKTVRSGGEAGVDPPRLFRSDRFATFA